MKIGVDASCWSNRRGFGRFTRELLTALVRLDRANEYVFFLDRQTASTATLPEGVRTVVAGTRRAPTEAASSSGRRSLGDMWALTRTVLRTELDVFFFPAVYSYFPILNPGLPIVVTIHDVIADRLPELVFPRRRLAWFWRAKERLARFQARHVLTVSHHSKAEIVRRFRIPESRVSAVTEAADPIFRPIPADEPESARVLARFGLAPGDPFLIYVGGISPHKNLATLIRAFGRLQREPDLADVRLLIVGDLTGDAFHTDVAGVKSCVTAQGLDGKVTFTGFVADPALARLYAAARLHVFPSFDEGFGLPAVEAMACGTPVVAAEAGSLPEIVGEGGVYFDPHREEALTARLRELLSDDARRTELAARALARAARFTWRKGAVETLAVLDAVART